MTWVVFGLASTLTAVLFTRALKTTSRRWHQEFHREMDDRKDAEMGRRRDG